MTLRKRNRRERSDLFFVSHLAKSWPGLFPVHLASGSFGPSHMLYLILRKLNDPVISLLYLKSHYTWGACFKGTTIVFLTKGTYFYPYGLMWTSHGPLVIILYLNPTVQMWSFKDIDTSRYWQLETSTHICTYCHLRVTNQPSTDLFRLWRRSPPGTGTKALLSMRQQLTSALPPPCCWYIWVIQNKTCQNVLYAFHLIQTNNRTLNLILVYLKI